MTDKCWSGRHDTATQPQGIFEEDRLVSGSVGQLANCRPPCSPPTALEQHCDPGVRSPQNSPSLPAGGF